MVEDTIYYFPHSNVNLAIPSSPLYSNFVEPLSSAVCPFDFNLWLVDNVYLILLASKTLLSRDSQVIVPSACLTINLNSNLIGSCLDFISFVQICPSVHFIWTPSPLSAQFPNISCPPIIYNQRVLSKSLILQTFNNVIKI